MAEMYYYNGVLLPKIPETKKFWGDREYPRILIRAWGNGYHSTYYGWAVHFDYYSDRETILISPYCYSSTLYPVENAVWTTPGAGAGAGYEIPISEIIWTNFDIKDDDGNVILPATLPVSPDDPVDPDTPEEPDVPAEPDTPEETISSKYNAFIQGWWLGRRLAAMRGKIQPVADTARLGLATLGRMILGKE